MNAETPISLRECARALGLSHSTVSRHVRDGIIPNRGSEHRPLVLLSEARAARQRELDLSKQRGTHSALAAPPAEREAEPDEPAGEPDKPRSLDFNTARTAREGYQARLAQLELEQRLGNLLDRAETIDAFFAMGAALREAMERRAPELAARLDGVADLNARTALILEDDRRVLQAIADDFARRYVGTSDAAAA